METKVKLLQRWYVHIADLRKNQKQAIRVTSTFIGLAELRDITVVIGSNMKEQNSSYE
jgi:hypothetical protein